MTPTILRGRRTVSSTAPALATAGAALLASDNLLGFAGVHVLHPDWSFGVATVTIAAAVLGAAAAAWCRDTVRSLVSCAVVVQVMMLSPAVQSAGWWPFGTGVVALVPLCLGAAATISLRRSSSRTHRMIAALVAVPAAAWFISAFVSVVPLECFLGAQVLTLMTSTALVARGALLRAASMIRHVWRTADVR